MRRHLPARSEQRQRENYFLGRHAPVKERSAIAALVLAQLRRIDEEAVVGGEESISAGAAPRQSQRVLAREEQRLLRTLGAQILAELVAEVGAGVALGVHRCRRVAVDRAVIGREQHGGLSARRSLENADQRGPLEPLPSDLAERDLVTRDLVKDLRLAAAVGEKIHEVEHEGAHALGSNRGAKMPLEVVGVGGGRDLPIPHRGLPAQLPEMRFEQLALVGVERFVLAIGIAPPVGKSRRYLTGK